jgi:hypothetical protein
MTKEDPVFVGYDRLLLLLLSKIIFVRNLIHDLYLLTPWCRTLFEKLIFTQLVKKYCAFFMEPKGSLPCSQKPAIGPYHEPAESSSPH